MTYIKLDDAVAAVEAQENAMQYGLSELTESLCALPSVSVTDEMVESAITSFTLSAARIEKDVRLCDLTESEVRMLICDALKAVFSPLPSPPSE